MSGADQKRALAAAIGAARAAGELMRRNLAASKRVNLSTSHDIKLELDVRCQRLIERRLSMAFPDFAVLGEEGESGPANTPARWVIDPIDGTVNFAYGIPHACVCIALQTRSRARSAIVDCGYQTVVGVIYDPFMDELWTARTGEPARLNGKPIQVSQRRKLSEAIVSTGFGRDPQMIGESHALLGTLVARCRKVRVMGSAGLAMAYVACGRFDGYAERVAGLWDIAAGGLIIERAGGCFKRERPGNGTEYRMITTNGHIHTELSALLPWSH
jgi:myo-inositol-1(or 4)-monophosphatase